MEGHLTQIKPVRAWKRRAPLPIPTIPAIPPLASSSAPHNPLPLPPITGASTQAPLRAKKRSKFDKMDDVLATYGFKSLGDFLSTLFHHHRRSDGPDPRTPRHKATVTSFLQGASACDEAYRRVGRLAQKSDDPERRTRVATWDDMNFTIQGLADQYREGDSLVWYLTECFAAPRVKGKVVIRKRRPHPVIQVAVISRYPLGIWHFICKSHVDVKRVYSRFGSIVSDSTARNALNSMSAASLRTLQESVRDATARGESEWGKILDNVQQHSPVYEHGLGRENQLKVGTACTAFRYDDCEPGAFDAQDHIDRVLAEDRKNMTTESILKSIDWDHNDRITDLHFVRVLAEFSPHLSHLSAEISELFRTVLAIYRIRVTKKTVQNLSTNSEREMTSQGMQRGRGDFDKQMGIEPSKCDNLLDWIRGDGGSHATLMNLKKYLGVEPNIYESCRNVISTPETWHTKATDLNSCASNHYGPAASKDPSSLSRSSNATNMKRPTDLKKCDFYPTSRSMTMIWEARVLDCWRLLTTWRYPKPNTTVKTPSAKAPRGSPWVSRSAPEQPSGPEQPIEPDSEPEEENEMEIPGLADIHDGNAILFLMEFGWWIELNYAIPEGDIGRVLEILKIFIFTFAGTSNHNYMRYMLDLYALLQFECSPKLKRALLNNWLISLRGILGTFIEGDLMQEHYNRWLEDMVRRRGGDFDDKFYRETISPNVQHFLEMKENVESAFELKRRGKAHTSPHLRDETRILLRMYEEEELHSFRSKRSMGHAAAGKLAEFLTDSAEYASMLRGVEKIRKGLNSEAMVLDSDPSPPPSPPKTPELNHSPPTQPGSPESEYSTSSSSDHSTHSTSSTSSTRSVEQFYSAQSAASRAAADAVEWWDDVDRSDERLTSGSDLAVIIDSETGKMCGDWFEEEEFEES
ncbi:hypothetical protein C8F04DRAFT_1244801 [Mycena alexandri]|uniref:DUF6589 domain-containing protein n=1 Tax=Mycena alexandri TaxID=1745969 RepID=A0AAD6RXH9_9AGAR|nr:hypothetical protein C8F04DRAFT_1244801 [Mycena alexandri]